MSYSPYIPISTASEELLFVAKATNESATLIVDEETVVVVPETVRFPDTTALPVTFKLSPIVTSEVV